MTSYLLSSPSPAWRIVGGANAASRRRAVTDPVRALAEWRRLADAITAHGGQVAVIPPPEDSSLTGLVYTSNAGHFFAPSRRFLLAQMSAAHRREERSYWENFFHAAGVSVSQAEHPWEGQAELNTNGTHYLLTWGVRSAPESVDEVRALLPEETPALGLQLRSPFTHGDSCLCFLRRPGGSALLLVYPGALLGGSLRELSDFLGDSAEVLPISEADALAYACSALSVEGTVLLPGGVSAELRESIARRGFAVEVLDLPELAGKGGGGLRALVNDLGDLPVPAGYSLGE
jgi:N-dimethylarginine dimethylaminohydrolase